MAPTEETTRRTAIVPAAVGFAIVLAFVLLYPVRGFHVPLGSDTPVYVWWARLAGATGLGSFQTGTRPGIVGLLATLSHLTRQPEAGVAAALTPALAAALALATAVLTTSALGWSRRRFVLVGLFVGTFLSFMVSGYESTVAFGAFFLGGLAIVSEGLAGSPTGPTVAAAAMIGAAGLVHPLFLIFGAALASGAALALLPSLTRDHRAGIPMVRSALGRLALASVGATALTAGGLLLSGAATGPVVDTSRDAILRRTGLRATLRASYLRKLRHDFPWWRTTPLLLLALAAYLPRARAMSRPSDAIGADRWRLFVGILGAWLAVTVVGVAALLAGTLTPGQRLADFCLPLPILAAVAVAGPAVRGPVAKAGAATGAAAFLALAILPWWSSSPLVTTQQVEQARAVGNLLAGQPAGTPVVVVMDDRSDKPGLFVTRYANLVRDEVPRASAGDVHFFVGAPSDFLAGRPTLSGQPEHDRMAVDSWNAVRPLVGSSGVLAVEVEGFDPIGYRQAAALDGAKDLRGVVILPGFSGRPILLADANQDAGAGPFSRWLLAWLGPLVLIAFALIGWPLVRIALPASPRDTAVALSPAAGAAALALASVVADAAGLRLAGPGAFVAGGLALTGWLAHAFRERVRASASGPTRDSP